MTTARLNSPSGGPVGGQRPGRLRIRRLSSPGEKGQSGRQTVSQEAAGRVKKVGSEPGLLWPVAVTGMLTVVSPASEPFLRARRRAWPSCGRCCYDTHFTGGS